MDEHEYRHARANADAALGLAKKALKDPDLEPDQRAHIEALLEQAEARIAALEATRPMPDVSRGREA